jgi:hypothetical protein
MWIKITVLVVLLIGCSGMLGREVLVLGRGRRTGEDPSPLFRRFRRRAKGLILLVLLYLFAAFFDEAIRRLHFTGREVALYAGFCLIMLVWLLLLAGRDVRETALTALKERRELTSDSFARIEEEIRRRREKKASVPRPPSAGESGGKTPDP